MLPFFRVARTAAAYVAPSGLGAPSAMQAMMIASATRSALALVLPGTRARTGRDQGETRARSQAPTEAAGPGSGREVAGKCVGPVRRERATAMYWYAGCDNSIYLSIAPGACLIGDLLHLCVARRCVGQVTGSACARGRAEEGQWHTHACCAHRVHASPLTRMNTCSSYA